MNKLWLLATSNIRKTKSVTITLTLLFVIASLLLSAGLLVLANYGDGFNQLEKELHTSDAYFMVPDALYNAQVAAWFKGNSHFTQTQQEEALTTDVELYSRASKSNMRYSVDFFNIDTPRDLSHWKFVGKHLAADDNSVYVPDLLKVVNGYQLNDPLKLTYIDAQGVRKSHTFVVKGYIEDLYFCSDNTGYLGFYLTGAGYRQLLEESGLSKSAPGAGASGYNPGFVAATKTHLVFANLADAKQFSQVEDGLRARLNAVSPSMSADTILGIDTGLVKTSRNMMASLISVILVTFASVIVIVCLLVVRFRIANSIDDDLLKIGSLKSIGYTSWQIIDSLLVQYGLIAGAAAVIGIAASYPLMPVISRVLEQQSGLVWTQGFDAGISALTLGVILVFVAVVALLAGRRVQKLSPINALRSERGERRTRFNPFPLDRSAGPLSVTLAFKSTLRGLSQSLMILVVTAAVAFAGAFGVVMYYNAAIDTTAFAKVPGSEMCNAAVSLDPNQDQTQTVQTIAHMKQVRKTLYFDEGTLNIDGGDIPVTIMANYAEKETRVVYEGRYPQRRGEIVLGGPLAERLGKTVGDTVAVKALGHTRTFTVVGLSSGGNMLGVNASVLTSDYLRLRPDFRPQTLYIYLKKGTNAADFLKKLEATTSKSVVKATVNVDREWENGMASYQSIVIALGIVMLVITIFVVALVLYFVISSSVSRHKRELGIQKALGFTTGQLMNQMTLSFAAPLVVGMATGCVLGAVYTNPLMSAVMKGMGVMKTDFIVNAVWVIAFCLGAVMFSWLLSLALTARIRRISAYALVTE